MTFGSVETRRQYSEDQVSDALVALQAHGGNVAQTSQDIGIPRPTLIAWRDGERRKPSSEDALSSRIASVTRKQARLARKWQRIVDLSLKRAEQLLMTDKPVMLRDLSWTAGVGTDKVQLLTGKPTERTELSLAAFLARESLNPTDTR